MVNFDHFYEFSFNSPFDIITFFDVSHGWHRWRQAKMSVEERAHPNEVQMEEISRPKQLLHDGEHIRLLALRWVLCQILREKCWGRPHNWANQ